MASKAAVRPLASLSAAFASAPRRHYATKLSQHSGSSSSRVSSQRPQIQSQIAARTSFRRGYADQAPVKPKKRAGFFRWAWRFTYLGAIAGLVWVGYGIYVERNPRDQDAPDPKKKTLVVLGISSRYPC